MKTFLTALVALLISVSGVSVFADDAKIRDEVAKELEKAGQDLVKSLSKIFEARISALEEALKAKDSEIAALKKQLADGGKEPAAVALSNAFFGIAHSARQENDGVLVDEVVPVSPAAKSGIAKGDVLVAIGDKKTAGADLRAIVGSFKPGDTVKVVLKRGNEEKTADVQLVDRDEFLKASKAPPVARAKGRLGILVGEEPGVGLWIEKVEDGLTGATVGLQVRDLLRSVNGRELKVLEDLQQALGGALEGDELTFELTRKDSLVTKKVVLGSDKSPGRLIEEKVGSDPVAKAVAVAKPASLGVLMEEGEGQIYVVGVVVDSTAAAYGLQVRDVLSKVNGAEIKTLDDLGKVLEPRTEGEVIDVVLVREEKEIAVNAIKLSAKGVKVAHVETPANAKPKPGFLGVVVEEAGEGQLVVSDIREGGPSSASQLQKGDVVLKLQDAEVKTIEEAEKILAPLFEGAEVSLVVKRGDAEHTIKVALGAKP